jgi:hypothetical protein
MAQLTIGDAGLHLKYSLLARRKINRLLSHHARVSYVSPSLTVFQTKGLWVEVWKDGKCNTMKDLDMGDTEE